MIWSVMSLTFCLLFLRFSCRWRFWSQTYWWCRWSKSCEFSYNLFHRASWCCIESLDLGTFRVVVLVSRARPYNVAVIQDCVDDLFCQYCQGASWCAAWQFRRWSETWIPYLEFFYRQERQSSFEYQSWILNLEYVKAHSIYLSHLLLLFHCFSWSLLPYFESLLGLT